MKKIEKSPLTAKVVKLMIQPCIAIENADGKVMVEATGQPFAMFAGQVADFHALITSIETAFNGDAGKLAELVAQGKTQA